MVQTDRDRQNPVGEVVNAFFLLCSDPVFPAQFDWLNLRLPELWQFGF